MNTTRKSEILSFLYENPRAPISLVADAVCTDNSTCSTVLGKLVSEGKAIREKVGRQSIYSASPSYVPGPRPAPPEPKFSTEEIARKEALIVDLEKRGLWRRALTELGLLAGMQKTAIGVGLIAQRRIMCMRKLAK